MADQLTSESIEQPPPPDFNAEIDVDAAYVDDLDADSAVGSESDASENVSVTSSIYGYRYENGRRYHAYRDGKYLLPNDEAEQDRLDLHHHIFRLVLGGRLFRAPIAAKPQRVLDFGTGTGIWALDFADEFPSATVIGTDLSPIQPTWVSPNCKFYVDDVESEWLYRPEEAFDFIHGRGMGGSIANWDALYRQAYTHLKPGGWLEMQEYEAWIWSDDDPLLTRSPYVSQWQQLVDEATTKFGKRLNVATEQKQHLINAGFVDVQDDVYKTPIGTWPEDSKLKEIGKYQLGHMCLCLETFTLALFTRVLNWTVEECQVLMGGVRGEFRNSKNHLYGYFHFVYGRKPTV